jgi:hypothetical protein
MARYSVRTIADRLSLTIPRARAVKRLLDGTLSPDNFPSVRKWEAECHNRPRRAERIFCALNELLRGFGVEPVRGADWRGGYYGDIVAQYVNMGDTYDATILQDTDSGQFSITSLGDFVERNEKRLGIV